MKNTRKRKIFEALFAVAILVFSALTVAAMGSERETTTMLVEVEDEEHMQYLEENTDLLVDYDNGRYLIEVSQDRVEDISSVYDTSIDDSRYKIHLDTIGESFDRREGTPDIQEEYGKETGSYIVQFIGPVKSMEWKEKVSDAGASVEREMANYALLVRMDEETKSEVQDLDIVDWVDPYYSGYKISEELIGSEKEKEMIKVTGWTQEDDQAIVGRLEGMGIEVVRETSTGPVLNVDPGRLPYIAGFDEVRRIDPYSFPETHDNVANEIHEVQSAWYPSWSGLPVELTGEGEVVGIQDTGFDEGNEDDGNPDFFQGSGGDRVIRYTDQGGQSDPDGNSQVAHGTHVAGIVGGNEYNWKNHMGIDPASEEWHHGEAAGVAPEVEFSLDGVTGFLGLQPDHSYWDNQEADGARVFQNSWGAQSAADYGSNSEDIDSRMDPYSDNAMDGAPENIIMFSAGNSGPGLHTMTPRPLAKNTIAVGASENFRSGEYRNANNPDYVADFSSRGGPDFSNGRIKPDIVTAGTAMISALARGEYENNNGQNQSSYITEVDEYDTSTLGEGSDGIPDYRYMQGTSMAGPHAAGMATLIREYYREMHGIQNPTNPLVKATMINGAERMDPNLYEYPGYAQGWGRPNLRKSLFPSAPRSNQFAEDTFDQTGTWDAETDGGMDLEIASDDEPFKATLNWLDSAGMEMNRELHMYAESPSGEVYYSGVDNYDENGWTTPGSTEVDKVNTVQRIEIQDPEPGQWTLTVESTNMPSTANFALVTSADFGPQQDYKVDLNTEYPTTQSLASGGTTHLPVQITNGGSSADTIALSDDSPDELSVSYSPGSTVSLESTEKTRIDVMITADTGLDEQVAEFEITAKSQDDSSELPASDTIVPTIQILTQPLPEKDKIADSESDEMFPEIITFADSEGTNWMFTAYQMVTPDGKQVRVKYSELGQDGKPLGWQGPFNPMSSDPTVNPNYVQLQHIDSGTHQDRVVVYWNGETPGSDGGEYEAKASWADHGSYDSWNGPSLIDNNHGSDTTNRKRGSYMLFRDDGTSDGELTYVFEHLDMNSNGQPSNIGIAYVTSDDGGETWNSANDVPGADGSGDYYYFFPNGVTDQNDVNWHFFYYRASDGNQRMVVTMLQDNDGWSEEVKVAGDLDGDPVDNHQFPMAEHYNNDGTNEIYMSCLYDNAGDFTDLAASYVTGDYSSSNPPAESDFTTEENVAGSSISQEDMTGADILGKAAGEDGWIWTSYLETDTPFDVPNINVARTDDKYGSVTVDPVTRDNYRKLNPNMASQTIDGTSYAYVAYHSSQGTTRNVDHEIYMSVLNSDWKTEPDAQGPDTSHVSANPDPVNLSTDNSFDLTSSIDETLKGRSEIQAAEYVETDTTITDPTTIDWTDGSSMTISGSSPTEIASADGMSVPAHWESGKTYRYWVRAQDGQGNWGTETASYVDIEVTGEESQDTYALTVDSTSGGHVELPGEGTFEYNPGEVVDLEAVADQDYSFAEWTGDTGTIGDSTASQTTITMDADYTITANFEAIEVSEVVIDPDTDQTVSAGEELQFQAEAYDQNGDLITDNPEDFTWQNADNGNFMETEVGDYDVTAAYSGETSPITVVTVEPAGPDHIEIVPQDETVDAGQTVTYHSTAFDQYGNEIGDVTGETTWSIEDGAGGQWNQNEYTSENGGQWTVTGTYTYDGADMTDQAMLEVVDTGVDKVVISPDQSQTITAGERVIFDAEAYDGNDNLITDDRMDFEWNTATRGVFNRRKAGDYEVTATFNDVTSQPTAVTVEPAGADSIEVAPEEKTVEAGSTVSYTAVAYDEYNNEISEVSTGTTWTIEDGANGEWSGSDYTTEKAGDWKVTGDYNGMTDTVLLTVETGPVDRVELTPSADQTITSGEKVVFSAVAYDSQDNVIADHVEAFEWENASRGVFYYEEAGEYEVTATIDGVTSEPTVVTVEENSQNAVETNTVEDKNLEFEKPAATKVSGCRTDEIIAKN